MNRNKMITFGLLGIFALAAVAATTAFRSVQASAPAVDNSVSFRAVAPAANNLTGSNFGMGFGGGTSDQELATTLGITVEKLQTAYTTATDEALKQAVTAGLITQAQADQIKARGGRFEGLGRYTNSTTIDYNALLAKALGISVDQLNAAYQKAFNARIDSAVTAGNLTKDQADLQKGRYALMNSPKFQSAIQSAYEAAVKQAITDGVITQAQADLILKGNGGKFSGGMGSFGGMRGGPEGRHGGMGEGGFGGRGHGKGNNPNSNTPTATPGASS
jgi:ribosomal protein S20